MISFNLDADTAALAGSIGGGLLAVARAVAVYGARIVAAVTSFAESQDATAGRLDRLEAVSRELTAAVRELVIAVRGSAPPPARVPALALAPREGGAEL